jgi:tetratricopeptide (TPR) repeat protein
MGFFKTGDEKFEQGNEFIKRKEYDKARKAFESALKKGSKEGEVAQVMIALLDLQAGGVQAYKNAMTVLQLKGDLEVEFGLFKMKCSQLLTECDAVHSELTATALPASGNAETLKERADSCFAAAMKYQTKIGPNTLIVPEVYTAIKVTGIQKANFLMAEGNENMAESVAMEDPKKAAEYLQIALNYRRQLGDANAETRISNKIRLYAKAAACWLCGREATGETIHFVSMPTEVTAMQMKSKQVSPLPSVENSASIFVCRACYLAISKRADAIAKQYHDIAMREMAAMERRLRSEINSVAARIR